MPKIKGWKKLADESDHKQWNSKNKRGYAGGEPSVVTLRRGSVSWSPIEYDGNWAVKVSRWENKNEGGSFFKEFDKKENARKWAVKWMKNHPNG